MITKTTKPEAVTYNMLQPYLPADETILAYFNGRESLTNEDIANILSTVITVIRERESGNYYVYNREGFYEPLPDWLLRGILKYVLTVAGIEWNSKTENQIITLFDRVSVTGIREFNAENALNLKNGVLQLDSGELREHKPESGYFTSVLSYEYNKDAECPVFREFMEQITCGDGELETVLQEILGYALSTKVDAEMAFFFYGGGCNGKSVLSTVIHSLIGEENTCAVPLEAFSGTFSLQPFIGKKLNISGENGTIVNAEKLKSLISADVVNVPIKYKEDWVGKLLTKHIFLMNSLPTTPDITHGFMRKILIIPFNYQVEPANMDKSLPSKLKAELSGILNYCLEGYQRLRKNGFVFTTSKTIEMVKREYMDRENPTMYFFHDTFEKSEDGRVRKSRIYQLYEDWCHENGYIPLSNVKFYNALNIKANEPHSDINLNIRQIKGIKYLCGYVEKAKIVTLIDTQELETG